MDFSMHFSMQCAIFLLFPMETIDIYTSLLQKKDIFKDEHAIIYIYSKGTKITHLARQKNNK